MHAADALHAKHESSGNIDIYMMNCNWLQARHMLMRLRAVQHLYTGTVTGLFVMQSNPKLNYGDY